MKRSIGDRMERGGTVYYKIAPEQPVSCIGCDFLFPENSPHQCGLLSYAPVYRDIEDGGTDCEDAIWHAVPNESLTQDVSA